MSENQRHKIGVGVATIFGMNAMIGAGIFTAPSAMASNVGPAGILAYLFVVVSVWFMGLSIARAAELFPEEGSFYAYVKPLFGKTVGLVANASHLLGIVVAMGLLTQNAGAYLHPFIPSVSPYLLGVIILAALVALNIFGVMLSAVGQRVLIACTLFPLIAIITICLAHTDLSNFTPFAPYGMRNVLAATRIVIFGFFGFECASLMFNNVIDPARNVPRALTYAVGIVGGLYLLFVTSLIAAIPLSLFEDPSYPLLTDVLRVRFPGNDFIIGAVHVSILSAMLGTVHSMICSTSASLSTLVELATDKKRHLTHQQSVLIVGLLIFLTFALLKNQGLFFGFTALFMVSAYIGAMLTLLSIKEEWTSGRNIRTLIGLGTASTILYFSIELIFKSLA